jgi:septum formation inhibitor-activating ATPase MinD
MSFSSGNLTVTKTDNTNGVYALNNLMFLNFTDLSTNVEEPLSVQKQMLSVYPNPVTNVLNIDITGTVQEEGTLIIFNFEGKPVLNRQVSHAGVLSLDISHLPKGLYLCRYANMTETRTVKIIKQ